MKPTNPPFPAAPGRATALPDDRTRWRILAVLLVTIFMSLVNVSTVNVGLPTIQHGLGASQSDLQWVLSGYALTFGVILVAAGRAGDILGRGGFFMIGVIVFTLASLACGLALTPRALNVARFVQGVGSGLISPQGIGMIQEYFRGSARGRAFGYFGSMVGFSVGVGPVLGGLLIELGGPDFGWRLAFLFNVPVGLIIMVMTWRLFPRPLFNRHAKGTPAPGWRATLARLDPVGSTLLGLAVFAVVVWARSRRSPHPVTRGAFLAMLVMVAVQLGLGILNVIEASPLPLALTHQFGAVALFVLILRARLYARYPYETSVRGTLR